MGRCSHKVTKILTEKDGCYWVACCGCKARGPKRHSKPLATKCAKGNVKVRP
jgi:hypothetical protein